MSNCTCLEEIRKQIEEKKKNEIDTPFIDFESSWLNTNYMYPKMNASLGMEISFKYRRIKRNGDEYKNLTKDEIMVTMNYCPLCGKEINKDESMNL